MEEPIVPKLTLTWRSTAHGAADPLTYHHRTMARQSHISDYYFFCPPMAIVVDLGVVVDDVVTMMIAMAVVVAESSILIRPERRAIGTPHDK